MRFFIACTLMALALLLTGCCGQKYGTSEIDCNNSLQCDLAKFFCMDEFTNEYWRNTFYCAQAGRQNAQPQNNAPAQVQTQAQATTTSPQQSSNIVGY